MSEFVATPGQEPSGDRLKHFGAGVKNWSRATLAMSAAALAAACSTTSTSTSHETYKGSPATTYSAPEVPGMQHQYSVVETFNALRGDPNIPKKGGTIDVASIAKQYHSKDYVPIMSTDPHTKQESMLDGGSAPVMEIRYNKTANALTYNVQTPQKLDNLELLQLLSPVVQNQLLLTTAFENNDVTRVVIRLKSPPLDKAYADYTSDEYIPEDWSTPGEGMQKTVFLFLPNVPSIDTQEIRDTLRHETIHGLTKNVNFSKNPEVSAAQNNEDLAKWNTVCLAMRDFSIQDAEKYKQHAITSMTELSNQLHNPVATEVLNQIIDALNNGTFDKYQPQQGENPNMAFGGTIPDCTAIGPWEVFVRLMDARGPKSLINKILTSPNQAIENTSASLQDDWQKMVEFQTIFRVLREGTYEQASPEKLLGHGESNLYELMTSTGDVAIAYPNRVAQIINELPPERRTVVLQLINLSLTTLNKQIPPNKNPYFHVLMTQRINFFNNIS